MDLLIVEDDRATGQALERGLNEAGHDCRWVRNGRKALEEALRQQYDAIVLDRMLPEVEGLEVLRQLRAAGVHTPVLLLTALGAVAERVEGLEQGADDYLVKPFAFPELLARLQSICRRSARPAPVQSAGGLTLDLATRRVLHGGNEVPLTPTEFSLLELLMRHAGQVVTRRMLCEHLWDANWEGTTNVIEVHINRLRQKLEKAGVAEAIGTVRGRGYAFRAT